MPDERTTAERVPASGTRERAATSAASGGGLLAGVGAAKVAAVVVAGLVVVGAGVGAWWFTQDDDDVDLEGVPDGVDSVTYVDVDRLSADPAVERVVDEALSVELLGEGPDDYAELKETFGNETGLAFEELHAVVSFSRTPEAGAEAAAAYTGAVLEADWAEEDLVEAQADQVPYGYEADEYGGTTVYKPDAAVGDNVTATWVGVLADGRYVLGTPAAVRDAVDVADGDAAALDGDLREAFEGARGGYVKFASAVPTEQVPEDDLPVGAGLDTGPYKDVELVAGAYYTEGNTMGVEMAMHTDTDDAAEDVAAVTQGLITAVEQGVGDDTLATALDDVEVTREGDTATVRFEDSVDDIEEILAAIDEQADEEDTNSLGRPPGASGTDRGGPNGPDVPARVDGPGERPTAADATTTAATGFGGV